MQSLLIKFERSLNRLEEESQQLRNNASKLKEHAETTLHGCLRDLPADAPFRKYCKMAGAILDDFDRLPKELADLTSLRGVKDELRRVISYNISGLLREQLEKFENLEASFQLEVLKHQGVVRKILREIGDELFKNAEKVSVELKKVDMSPAIRTINHVEAPFLEYEFFRWICGFALTGFLLIITILYGLGLFYGCCGNGTSDVYYGHGGSCLRATGSKFYCCGIWLTTLSLVWLMSITVVLFFAGGNAHGALCDPLRRPHERRDMVEFAERILELADRFPDQFGGLAELSRSLRTRNLTIAGILEECSGNGTLYNTLSLASKYRLSDLTAAKKEAYEKLESYLSKVVADVSIDDSFNWHLIPADVERKLFQLQRDRLVGIPFHFIRALETNAEKLDFSAELEAAEKALASSSSGSEAEGGGDKDEFRRLFAEVRGVQTNSAEPLRRRLIGLAADLTQLNHRLPKLTANIPKLVLQLKHAQSLLNTNVSGQVHTVAARLAERLRYYIDVYATHVEQSVRNELCSCRPLRLIANASRRALCDQALNPFNGFWAAATLCLLLLMPIVLLAASLRDLYSNTEDDDRRSKTRRPPYMNASPLPSAPARRRRRRRGASQGHRAVDYGETLQQNGTAGGRKRTTPRRRHSRAPSLESTTTSFVDESPTPPACSVPPPPYNPAQHSHYYRMRCDGK